MTGLKMMRCLVLAVLFGLPCLLLAQDDVWKGFEKVFVEDIIVEGNKHTRSSVILRELHFAKGDSIPITILAKTLELSEQMVMNTGLFNEVNISFKDWEGATSRVRIMVEVKETWYLYPIPRFELADRNFNVWWVEQNRSFDRVNYGLELTHQNLTGRRDKFQIGAIFGYTQNFSLSYGVPALNKGQTIGLGGELSFSRNREVNYATLNNKQEFYNDESTFVFQRFRANIGMTVRPALRTNHLLLLEFSQNKVEDQVATELNPNFFLEGRTLQRYFTFLYKYSYENRDAKFYPWSGDYFELEVIKEGLGVFNDVNGLSVSLQYDHHFAFSKHFSLGASAKGKAGILRSRQPYLSNRSLGYSGNDIRGYEYYIIDGMDFLLLRTSLHYFLWETRVNFGKFMPIQAFREMPVRFYFSLNNDLGIANDPYGSQTLNPLNSKLLWGGGLGLNIILFYNKVFRIEYSANRFNERGLFFHLNFNI